MLLKLYRINDVCFWFVRKNRKTFELVTLKQENIFSLYFYIDLLSAHITEKIDMVGRIKKYSCPDKKNLNGIG